MTLVSDRARDIRIYVTGGTAHAETFVGACRSAILQRVFLTTRKASFFNQPLSAELYGLDSASGEHCYEKVSRSR